MKFASPYAVVAGGLIAGLYVVRAALGVPAGWAYGEAAALDASGRVAEAGRLMDRAAVGRLRTRALWRAGRARTKSWHALPPGDRHGKMGDDLLAAAATRFLNARAVSPGSAWFTSALADVYSLRERSARESRIVNLATLSQGAWALLGNDGCIAIGLVREAIDREPSNFENRDQLVFVLEENGLHDEALVAMAESARVLPDFGAHPDFVFEEFRMDLVEAFWRSSRAVAPLDVPLMSPDRKLFASGILGRRLGHLEEAEKDLRAALNEPGTSLSRAEVSFHLGLVLVDLGRFDEAETLLAQALSEPVFGPAVAGTRARVAAKRERWPEALAQLREARRLSPRELWILLEFARVAQKTGSWGQAEESLRWAVLVHPEAPSPRLALVELFLAQGDGGRARGAVDEYVSAFGNTEDAARMERALAGPLDPNRP